VALCRSASDQCRRRSPHAMGNCGMTCHTDRRFQIGVPHLLLPVYEDIAEVNRHLSRFSPWLHGADKESWHLSIGGGR
jgi:hypothetical protein